MKWFIENWPKATIFCAIYLGVALICFVAPVNFPLFLIWIQTVVYFVHQFEEYILPGGFLDFFNKKMLGSNESEFPMDKKASFLINIPLIFIAFPVSALLATYFGIGIGLWTAYFSVLNAFSHVIMAIKNKYNPGLVVSIILNIPIGIYTIYYFISNDIVSITAHVIGLLIAVAAQVIMMFYGFKILKPRIK